MKKTVAVAAVCGLAFVSACSSSGSSSGTAATTSTTNLTVAVAQWYEGVQKDFQTVLNDFQALDTASNNSDTSVLGNACSKMTTDVQTLQADPPPPDAAMNTPYQAGLTDFAKAGSECATGISTQDVALLKQAVTDATTGSSQLSQVAGQMEALGGGSSSTTAGGGSSGSSPVSG